MLAGALVGVIFRLLSRKKVLCDNATTPGRALADSHWHPGWHNRTRCHVSGGQH
jgi:hypothetical protein